MPRTAPSGRAYVWIFCPRLAGLQAGELATPERGATLREVAARACVGLVAARHALCYLRRSAAVVIVRTRRVPYRNKPVAEYALPDLAHAPEVTSGGGMGALLSAWSGAVDNF